MQTAAPTPTLAPGRTRPISVPDEELRVYVSTPRRSLVGSLVRTVLCLILGVALGAAAWEGYAYLDQPVEPAAPAATPVPPAQPVQAALHVQKDAKMADVASTKAPSAPLKVPSSKPSPATIKSSSNGEAEFNEDF